MSDPVTAPELQRAQRIMAEVNHDMPDAGVEEAFAEYVRRLSDPTQPKQAAS